MSTDRESLVVRLEAELVNLTSTSRAYDVSRALGLALRLLADLGYDFTVTRMRAPEPVLRPRKPPTQRIP